MALTSCLISLGEVFFNPKTTIKVTPIEVRNTSRGCTTTIEPII
jgi:hypothetical protein